MKHKVYIYWILWKSSFSSWCFRCIKRILCWDAIM